MHHQGWAVGAHEKLLAMAPNAEDGALLEEFKVWMFTGCHDVGSKELRAEHAGSDNQGLQRATEMLDFGELGHG